MTKARRKGKSRSVEQLAPRRRKAGAVQGGAAPLSPHTSPPPDPERLRRGIVVVQPPPEGD